MPWLSCWASSRIIATADTLDKVIGVVRRCARSLVNSDGVSFVLREGDQCFYAEEDAIAPLWKGSRFPLEACVSGWVMLNAQIAIIPNIYSDIQRVPHEAYRPTFVKSMAMVPVPQDNPVAAIGAYWGELHEATWAEQYTLQAIANAAGMALKNMPFYIELQRLRSTASDSDSRYRLSHTGS